MAIAKLLRRIDPASAIRRHDGEIDPIFGIKYTLSYTISMAGLAALTLPELVEKLGIDEEGSKGVRLLGASAGSLLGMMGSWHRMESKVEPFRSRLIYTTITPDVRDDAPSIAEQHGCTVSFPRLELVKRREIIPTDYSEWLPDILHEAIPMNGLRIRGRGKRVDAAALDILGRYGVCGLRVERRKLAPNTSIMRNPKYVLEERARGERFISGLTAPGSLYVL